MKKINKIKWLETVESTNDYVREHIEKLDNLSVISAKCQNKGRGQRGNTWISEPGANLTFTLLLKYGENSVEPLMVQEMFIISQITALSIIELLLEKGIPAKIKWPNDIYVNNKKICGILIENKIKDNTLTNSIIGVGLNVNQTEFLGNYTVMPSSIKLENQTSEDLALLLNDFLRIFKEYLPYIETNSGQRHIQKKYKGLLFRKDEEAEFILLASNEQFKGIIRDVSTVGTLCVEIIEGEIVEFAFNEIRYVI